jgi:transcriptional regulator with AAA-type ATPase domain
MPEPDIDTLEDSLASHRPGVMRVHPYLFIVLECDRPASGGARYALAGVDEVVLGRGAERGAARQSGGGVTRLLVRIPGRSISSTHARLLREGDGWVLEDTHSTNGSFVNGVRVERVMLREGDVIELGHTILVLRGALPTPLGTVPTFDSNEISVPAAGMMTLHPNLFAEFATLTRISGSELPMLLLGDTGTGKEVLARAVHKLSARSGPFVAVNCGALPPNLVESQLFGHVKGSFSGAVRDEPGLVRSAERGTLLLDEIGDLPSTAQPALLRVLQEQEVIAVGSVRPTKVDVRILAATHQPLERFVEEGRFRRDLFARLDGFRFKLPTLQNRREDLGVIIAEILRSAPDSQLRLTAEAGVALAMYDWPFNIRELVQRLKRAQVLAQGTPITPAHFALQQDPHDSKPGRNPASAPPLSAEDARLRREILDKLEEHGGNIAEVAREMGKARMQVHRWLKRFGIDAGTFRK